MKYICTNCNYIFDEVLDNTDDSIKKVNSETICPVCSEKDTFQGIEEEVNYITNNKNLEFGEAEHFPIIVALDEKGQRIKVSVGLTPHPMGQEHKIISISLFDEYGDLVEEELLFEYSQPEVEFDVYDLDEYEIRVKCSVHGVWGKKVVK